MVSLQAAVSPKERRACPTSRSTDDSSSRKRKWAEREEGGHHLGAGLAKELKLWKDDDAKPMTRQPPAADNIDLHLETPLPPEWQRCLDIQSGRIHFYNTRTHKRTSRDPRESGAANEEAPSTDARFVSLDLELNLTCEPSPKSRGTGGEDGRRPSVKARASPCDCTGRSGAAATLCMMPSWVSLNADAGEMVATVCGRCHMLVMMCRSSPSCPNCKFSHLPEQVPSSSMLKPGAQALVL